MPASPTVEGKMKLSKYEPNARRTRLGVASVAALGLLVAIPASAQAAAPVPLGTANSFVVLAGAGITNTGNTTLNGSIGTFPTPSITGLSTVTLNATNHGADVVTQGAKKDLTTAYTTAAGAGPTTAIPVELGEMSAVRHLGVGLPFSLGNTLANSARCRFGGFVASCLCSPRTVDYSSARGSMRSGDAPSSHQRAFRRGPVACVFLGGMTLAVQPRQVFSLPAGLAVG
jgi:Ice-binding-like